MDALLLVETAKKMNSIVKFVYGPGLKDMISQTVGDIHFDAAHIALETASISRNPNDRINSAITHLEAAHAAYRKILSSLNNDIGFLTSPFRWKQEIEAKRMNVAACSLLAMCYAGQGDKEAALDALKRGDDTFKLPELSKISSVMLTLFGQLIAIAGAMDPTLWIWMRKDMPKIGMSEEQYNEFKSTLQRTLHNS